MVTNQELIQQAKQVAKLNIVGETRYGDVGCALVTKKGNIYTGISILAGCGVGFCAEDGAVQTMVVNQEYEIEKLVSIDKKGNILPPCGRCRELIYQINPQNTNTRIILQENKTATLKELLPEPWQEKFY